nr:DUF535 family protein [Sphingobium nicotianae]
MRPFRPLSCAGWSGTEKLDRILDHFNTVRALGGVLMPERDAIRTLAKLQTLGEDYRLTIDEPGWMSFDGLTTLSLWKGIDRLFSISFVLSSAEGRLHCYIGGLQGRGDTAVRDLYRDMTKEAHGLRPRDLMIELHRMMCRALGVSDIQAVADEARFHRDGYYRHSGYGVTSFNYDEAWADRGGVRLDRNWYRMPVDPVRRDAETIPARKRSLYRQRYALLDALELEIHEAVSRMIDGRGARTARTA